MWRKRKSRASRDGFARKESDELQAGTVRQRLVEAQQMVCRYVSSNVSLADELIAERRAAVRCESNRDQR